MAVMVVQPVGFGLNKCQNIPKNSEICRPNLQLTNTSQGGILQLAVNLDYFPLKSERGCL